MGAERVMQVCEAFVAARRVDAIGQLERPGCCCARAVDLAGLKMTLGEPARVERRFAGARVAGGCRWTARPTPRSCALVCGSTRWLRGSGYDLVLLDHVAVS